MQSEAKNYKFIEKTRLFTQRQMNHCIKITMRKKKFENVIKKRKKKEEHKHSHTHTHTRNYINASKRRTMTTVNIVKTIILIINNFIYVNFDKSSQT